MDVVDATYEVAEQLRVDERYALKSQMVRAAISIPANIAEGNRRGTRTDYAQFISISRGPVAELETYVLIAMRRSYLSDHDGMDVLNSLEEIGRMLTALRRRLIQH